MKIENTEYGARIRKLRESQKLSREKLAERANISTQFLADIESGKKGMTVVTLRKLCAALHVSADSIVFGNETSDIPEIDAMVASIPAEKREDFVHTIQSIIKLI